MALTAFAVQLLTAFTARAVTIVPASPRSTSFTSAVSAEALADAPVASLVFVSATVRRLTTASGAALIWASWFDGFASSVSGVGATTRRPSERTERP